jgi:hypothetical protein
LRRRLCELHAAWQHLVYNDAGCREIIKREFPHLLALYDNYPSRENDILESTGPGLLDGNTTPRSIPSSPRSGYTDFRR